MAFLAGDFAAALGFFFTAAFLARGTSSSSEESPSFAFSDVAALQVPSIILAGAGAGVEERLGVEVRVQSGSGSGLVTFLNAMITTGIKCQG